MFADAISLPNCRKIAFVYYFQQRFVAVLIEQGKDRFIVAVKRTGTVKERHDHIRLFGRLFRVGNPDLFNGVITVADPGGINDSHQFVPHFQLPFDRIPCGSR